MSSDEPSDTMRERAGVSRYTLWLLLRTNRLVVAAMVSLATFVLLVALVELGPSPLRRVVGSHDALWAVFSSLIMAVVTVVALVVTVNQLVLSQELGALGDQRERMDASTEFRRDLEPWIDPAVAPPAPSSFLAAILEAVQAIGEELVAVDGSAGADEVRSFAEELTTNARSVADDLDDAQFGSFDLVFAALNFNYSWKIYEARRLLDDLGDTLDETTVDHLEDLVTVLEFYGPAREHFKTLYFQWELVNLSRRMLYSSVPALLVALTMLLAVDPAGVTGTVLGIDALVWLVCAAAVLTLTPFFLLISYVLRIATIAKRTLAIGPFVLRDSERSG